jgi:ribosomal protein L44E
VLEERNDDADADHASLIEIARRDGDGEFGAMLAKSAASGCACRHSHSNLRRVSRRPRGPGAAGKRRRPRRWTSAGSCRHPLVDEPQRRPTKLAYGTSGLLRCQRINARCERGDPLVVIAEDR